MKRSYIALAVVMIASAIAIYLHLQPPPVTEGQPEKTKTQAKTLPPQEASKPKETPASKVAPAPKVAPEPKTTVPTKEEPPTKAIEQVPTEAPKEAPKETPKETSKETPKEAPPAPTVDADAASRAADAALAANRAAEAIKAISECVRRPADPAKAEPLKARLSRLVEEHFFSSKPSPLATVYTVIGGDNLTKIASKNNLTEDYLARLNALPDRNVIRIGQKLKIIPGAFDVEVEKSRFLLTVLKDGIWVREIRVGLGKDGSTPVGEFVAGTKLKNPPYTAVHPPVPPSDHKNNPLGTRWVTIKGAGGNEYGIHGTWEPDTMGKEASKGCIRMRNEDVEWLYDLIIPEKSKITIKP